MQVVIAMAGLGQRFKDSGYTDPKPFIKIKNKFMFEYLVEKFPIHWNIFFVINEDLENKYINILNLKNLHSKIIKTKYSERGPIDTVLTALPYLDLNEPTIISYCDFSLEWIASDFEEKILDYDAAVVGYTGKHQTFLGPNSYCHYLVQNDQVTELQEKKLYTDSLENEWTSCGLYYFKSAAFLKGCLAEQEKQNLCYNNQEYYTSLSLQAALNINPNLRILNYQIYKFYQFGTPFDIDLYLNNHQ